jgi:sialate O-acetylesterase
MLPALPAGGPHELQVSGRKVLRCQNVLVGEVWICSGQSNMEFTTSGAAEVTNDILQADLPQIRLFTVGKQPSGVPLSTVGGAWQICSPGTVSGFSAVGFFFGRQLHQELKIPVGLICAAWGGTNAETWTPLPALRSLPWFADRLAAYEASVATFQADRARYEHQRQEMTRNFEALNAKWLTDLLDNDLGSRERWADPAFRPDDAWKPVEVPMPMSGSLWANYMGCAWARREIEIPAAWVGKDLKLDLGPVDDGDRTFVNGTLVGATLDSQYWQTPRHYTVPGKLITGQRVVLAVHAYNGMGAIGLIGAEPCYRLAPVDDPAATALSLAGTWQQRLGSPADLKSRPSVNLPRVPGGSAGEPGSLWNGMLAPLTSYGIRGVIWYQGEANASSPDEYRALFPAMITGWRAAWGQGELPFLFVQLANFMGRHAQASALALPATGMALAIDIGEDGDIHPRNKQDVGRRLALWAMAKTYGLERTYSGPLYKALSVEGNRARIAFDHAGGLAAKGSPLVGFAVAGTDKIFHRAQAEIAGETVAVWSDQVAQPVAVRYAWANNPICNLYNAAGLPAAPFRSDDWKPGEFQVAVEQLSEAK